ncbi:two-component system sensor histidine kinase NtrB [Dissulfurispira sp.]|uniref:two-component system sensor histidine kinase NtrB n=1 Tax=Dissulfurispira sp. TaxID=2817609 RepID=UPI002FD8A11B
MKAGPDILIIFLTASVFLILLFIVAIFLPRLLKKEETKTESAEINTVVNAFRALGDEIKSLKEQLVIKERLAALGEVSAGIAHEFRNPMGVIAGYTKLLLKSLDENDRRREIVQGILNEIEDMNRVMEELLKFSRSEPIKKIDINLTKSIKDVIQSMGDSADKIDFSLLDDVSIKGDETLLKQAIKNLVHNAIDAGDSVWIDVEKGVSLNKKGVFIVVRDNGAGIPVNDVDRIFMPFYTTKDKGSGIGLALVQKIVTEHGGNISVESREGEGSTFRVFLPIE